MFSDSICYGPTCLKAGAPESKVCRRYRPPKFETWAQNAQNSKKPTRTARISLDILDWRCVLTRYGTDQLVGKLWPPKARWTEDTSLQSSKFRPTNAQNSKRNNGTPTRTARFSLDFLVWRCSLTRYVTGQLARKLGPLKATFAEVTGIESLRFGPTMPKTAKNHGTPTRTAQFSLDILDWRCSLTRYGTGQLT